MGGELVEGGRGEMSMKRMRRKVEVWCISIEVCVSFNSLARGFRVYRIGILSLGQNNKMMIRTWAGHGSAGYIVFHSV